MYKAIIILVFSVINNVFILAQQRLVAVFDPICDLSSDNKTLMRENVSTVIANSTNYRVVERSLIQKVLEENKFQAKGLVEESQLTEMGRMIGAQLVCLVVGVSLDKYYYISIKLVDLETGKVVKQKTGQDYSSVENIVLLVQRLSNELLTKS